MTQGPTPTSMAGELPDAAPPAPPLSMARFSANLGFLWTDRPLTDAVGAAADAGFGAVEAHFPYDTPAPALRRALDAVGRPLLGINTRRGDAPGDFGLCALPDRREAARAAIDEAVDYAVECGARAVHVMAGKAAGPEAEATFLENLAYARDRAGGSVELLIEPLNHHDVPGYFLTTMAQARNLVETLGGEGVAVMFDIYHRQRVEGDLLARFVADQAIIGHVQFAGAPDRGAPDLGEVNIAWLLRAMDAAGYRGFFGAEYKPAGETETSLGWLRRWTTA